MNACPFVFCGDTDGFWLSDLKPTGYLENSELIENGTDADFTIQILNDRGTAIATYMWKHTTKKSKWNEDGHWMDPSFEDVIPHQEGSDYFFKAGVGLWTTSPEKSEDDLEAKYQIISSGAVTEESVTWTLSKLGGAVAVANPYPLSFLLSSLTPEGYLDNTELIANGTDADFTVQLLNQRGTAIATYMWKHTTKKSKWNEDGHWMDPSFEDVIPGGENDLSIEPGQGLWVTAPEHSEDDMEADYTITVNFPGPKL